MLLVQTTPKEKKSDFKHMQNKMATNGNSMPTFREHELLQIVVFSAAREHD